MESDAHFAEVVEYAVQHNLDPDRKVQIPIILSCIQSGYIVPVQAVLDYFPAAADDLESVHRLAFFRAACAANNMAIFECLQVKALLPRLAVSDIAELFKRAGATAAFSTMRSLHNILSKVINEDPDPSATAVATLSEAIIRHGLTDMLQSVFPLWDFEMDSAHYLDQTLRAGQDIKAMFLLKHGAKLAPSHLILIVDKILDGEMDKDVLALAFRNLLKRGLNVDFGFMASKIDGGPIENYVHIYRQCARYTAAAFMLDGTGSDDFQEVSVQIRHFTKSNGEVKLTIDKAACSSTEAQLERDPSSHQPRAHLCPFYAELPRSVVRTIFHFVVNSLASWVAFGNCASICLRFKDDFLEKRVRNLRTLMFDVLNFFFVTLGHRPPLNKYGHYKVDYEKTFFHIKVIAAKLLIERGGPMAEEAALVVMSAPVEGEGDCRIDPDLEGVRYDGECDPCWEGQLRNSAFADFSGWDREMASSKTASDNNKSNNKDANNKALNDTAFSRASNTYVRYTRFDDGNNDDIIDYEDETDEK
ncbi:hypothetical protein HDV00_007248 [Rhizophlyctis rosea]|nr:hypothetical protein HDV00_007248 [Rhizophlyctis rosea]